VLRMRALRRTGLRDGTGMRCFFTGRTAILALRSSSTVANKRVVARLLDMPEAAQKHGWSYTSMIRRGLQCECWTVNSEGARPLAAE
jgi:hypothetical protein